MATTDWRTREGQNQTHFRDLNESIVAERDGGEVAARATDPYVCECSDLRCSDEIHLTRLEYEAIREESERFAIALDHDNPEIDRLVSENNRFAVVQILYRPAARLARLTDRRRDSGPAFA